MSRPDWGRHSASGALRAAPFRIEKAAAMQEYLCGLSAFRLHRIPPQVLALCSNLPDIELRSDRRLLGRHPEILGSLGSPLHVLTDNRGRRNSAKAIEAHLWTGELPPGAFMENELGTTLASPAFTLLTMAPQVSDVHLLMAASELCGEFAIYQPTPQIQRELDQLPPGLDGAWRQVTDVHGEPTNLWRRPPLLDAAALNGFVTATSGMRGHKKLAWAARNLKSPAFSPFEVQTSILLGLSRSRGGAGLDAFESNFRIRLSPAARLIAGQDECYADLFFEATDAHGPIDIECQGRMVHASSASGELDANRTLALQSMGIEILLLTFEQIFEQKRYDAVVAHLESLLNMRRRPRNARMREAEFELRRQLFIDWRTLGT